MWKWGKKKNKEEDSSPLEPENDVSLNEDEIDEAEGSNGTDDFAAIEESKEADDFAAIEESKEADDFAAIEEFREADDITASEENREADDFAVSEEFNDSENFNEDDESVDSEDYENEASSEEKKESFWTRLFKGLFKSRKSLREKLAYIFGGVEIDDEFYEDLEEVLITSDMGVEATEKIIEDLKVKVKDKKLKKPSECRELLKDTIKEDMDIGETAYDFENRTSVVFVIGVNGVGKTTTIGKLAQKLKKQKKKVLIAAADTFRAAANEQLTVWAKRAKCDIIGGNEGQDPSSVVFDAVNAAKARNVDVLLVDTAGRLQNKKNLMNELSKMNKVIDREFPEAYRETLLVLDAATGQNAIMQAREFSSVCDISGIVLTKMDGSAKGGIAVAIHSELGIPVKYIGVGETVDDLEKFDSNQYVDALFAEED